MTISDTMPLSQSGIDLTEPPLIITISDTEFAQTASITVTDRH